MSTHAPTPLTSTGIRHSIATGVGDGIGAAAVVMCRGDGDGAGAWDVLTLGLGGTAGGGDARGLMSGDAVTPGDA